MRLLALSAAAAGLLHGDVRCVPCHSQQVRSWIATGMGRSIKAAPAVPNAIQTIRHDPSGTLFRVKVRSGKVIHEATRNGVRAEYAPEWVLGSGRHGESYLIRVQDALFQSPVSWYAERRAYDMSPGFETDPKPDFFRPVTPECLFCHSGSVQARAGTQNRYLNPPFQPATIGCDRCHGDAESHLANPGRGSIVNPARLSPELRDSVCEQCHLSGEARIPNPGREFSDFKPGMRMEDVFSVYIRDHQGQGLKVVSHSEQLAISQCSLRSNGKLWCGSCHDPHAEPTEKTSWYRNACIRCHESAQVASHERIAGRECTACHMPRLKTYDGGHTAFTDHQIHIPGSKAGSKPGSDILRAWREPDPKFRRRNLALAYISTGRRSGDANDMLKGFQLLDTSPRDGAVETARGMMLLRLNHPAEAVNALRNALAEDPRNSTRNLNLAVALFAVGDRANAKARVEQAIEIEPLLEDAYFLGAEIDPIDAAEWKQRYLGMLPQRLLH